MTDSCMPLLLLCVGNENLHLMTMFKRQRLNVHVGDFEGRTLHAEYYNFRVGSFREKYRLESLGMYRGTPGQYDVKTWTEVFWKDLMTL